MAALRDEPAAVESRSRVREVLLTLLGAGVVLAVVVLASGRAPSGPEPAPGGDDGTSRESWKDLYRGENPTPEASPAFEGGCKPDRRNPARIALDLPASGLDLGAVRQEESTERTFTFRSAGTGTLCLLGDRPHSTCSCIQAEYVGPKRRFEPGEAGQVLVRYRPSPAEGERHKQVTIRTNDPDVPEARFPVHVSVSLGLLVDRTWLDFRRGGDGESLSARVRLKSPKTDAAWRVTEVVAIPGREHPSPPALAHETREVDDPDQRVVDLVITVPGGASDGPRADVVAIRTTHPDRREVRLRVLPW